MMTRLIRLISALVLMYTVPAWALQVLYTAEGDTTMAMDQLTDDGAQDGTFTQTWSNNTKTASANVYVSNNISLFGTNVFRFNQTPNYVHTIDIADSTTLGSAFTLAAYVRPDFAPIRKRIFSTYPSTAGTANLLIFDYGSNLDGMRLAINGVSLIPSPAVTIPSSVYSHLAATYDNGAVKLYLNGKEVGSGTAGSGTPTIDHNASWRIQVGEDWLWGGGNFDQTIGYMDDILIYDRALSSNEIAQVAYYSAEVFFSGNFIYPGILYTAEGDITNATDKLISDNSQDGLFSCSNVTVSASNPKFGDCAFNFTSPTNLYDDLQTIALPGSKSLGARFTLAAYVDSTSLGKQRLFSSYPGGGNVTESILIFEFDPDGSSGFSMRVNHDSTLIEATATFADGDYHHLATTYDDGELRLYLDGTQVGIGTNGSGVISMSVDLRVGEDTGSVANEQLIGDVDDIVFLRKALSPSEIILLMEKGGQQFLAPSPPPPKGTIILIN